MARVGREAAAVAVLVGLASVALVAGWNATWFLCDDAYISFRYVDHWLRGWGLVWNPAPFAPVEGYTSFSWVILLGCVWWLCGVEPPEASPVLGLGFGLATVLLSAAMVLRVPWSDGLRRLRVPMLAVVLFGIVSNRTFLTWTSSGLETALVSLLLVSWAAVGLLGRPLADRRHRAALVGLAALLALTRPDGYLFCAASVAVAALAAVRRGASAADLLPLSPLLGVLAHVAWRRSFYGLWLPNTYYAKHVAPWPEAGLEYASAFLLEYGAWVWVVVALLALGQAALRLRREGFGDEEWVRAAVWGALVAQVAYYVLLVGGDHFEFRIFHHLVPLLVWSLPWLTDRLGWRPAASLGALVGMLAVGLAIPWVHFAHTDGIATRDETRKLRYRVAPHFPLPLRWYPWLWDTLEDDLIAHLVGVRQPTHREFWRHQLTVFPSREEGLALPSGDLPVFHHISVGVPGWTMPTIAIIDDFGLNDRVIAASPPRSTAAAFRYMAHDRVPPKGYVECFRPNVVVSPEGHPQVRRRSRPLTAEEVRDCESRFLPAPAGTP